MAQSIVLLYHGSVDCTFEVSNKIIENMTTPKTSNSRCGSDIAATHISQQTFLIQHPPVASQALHTGADPKGGFGDLSPLNFLEVKII